MGWVNCPVDLAIRSNGDTYVTDCDNNLQVQVFDLNGTHKLAFGAYGTGPGQLREPEAIALTPGGTVLIADTFNARMEVFDLYGNFLHLIFGNQPGPGQLLFPVGIAFETDGTIVITNIGECDR